MGQECVEIMNLLRKGGENLLAHQRGNSSLLQPMNIQKSLAMCSLKRALLDLGGRAGQNAG
jgi:hypothetical protein